MYFIDIPSDILGDLDKNLIEQARVVVSNATMAEIINDDPQSPAAFHDSVRQQILALWTRLRVSLVIIDKLMGVANALNAKLDK